VTSKGSGRSNTAVAVASAEPQPGQVVRMTGVSGSAPAAASRPDALSARRRACLTLRAGSAVRAAACPTRRRLTAVGAVQPQPGSATRSCNAAFSARRRSISATAGAAAVSGAPSERGRSPVRSWLVDSPHHSRVNPFLTVVYLGSYPNWRGRENYPFFPEEGGFGFVNKIIKPAVYELVGIFGFGVPFL
jgi:hypothetical protein